MEKKPQIANHLCSEQRSVPFAITESMLQEVKGLIDLVHGFIFRAWTVLGSREKSITIG